jgi:hypothetical protein
MGNRGAKLYQDDRAADLKNTIGLVCKVPVEGDRLLGILADLQGDTDPSNDDAVVFWLVVADRFERLGIACAQATATALTLIENGTDLTRLAAAGADDEFLAQRRKELDELAHRLRNPRAARSRKTPREPPDFCVNVGDVYAFPTSRGFACSPHRRPDEGPFVADGWGAMVVLDRGRAFDWLPWCALASLTVDPGRRPTLDDAKQALLITHMQTNGAARCVPKRADLETMDAQLIGHAALDSRRVAPVLSRWSILTAIECGWSVATPAYARDVTGPRIGAALRDLLLPAD